MINPYFLMSILYLFVALLAALDASLVSFNLVETFVGVRWLRVHFVTLGLLTEISFGVLPPLLAGRWGRPRPPLRWDIWLALNGGLVVLLAGITSLNQVMILTGGTLIFVATILLIEQLWKLRGDQPEVGSEAGTLKFYLTGLVYLLVGILVGTGLWLGWSGPLRIQVPLEVHIHANNWGFMSLLFAGLLIDVIPRLTGRPLGSQRTLNLIYWGMTLGAFGLVLGPWLGNLPALIIGLLLHLSATIVLVISSYKRLRQNGQLQQAGSWHLLGAYIWILMPILVAPMVIFELPGLPGVWIEATAPQALVYGWLLQFGLALIPFVTGRLIFQVDRPALGGTWWTLLAVNIGSAFVWASIFIEPWRGLLHGTAYVFYTLTLWPAGRQLWKLAGREENIAAAEPLPRAGD